MYKPCLFTTSSSERPVGPSDSPPPPEGAPSRRILVVDDHAVVRQGIAYLIGIQPDLEVCGEAEDAPSALSAVERAAPDAVAVDLTLKQGNGLELIKDIHTRWPELPILVVSMHDEKVYGERCLRAGASGYIMKAEAIETVIEGLRKILAGELFLSRALTMQMLGHRLRGVDATVADPVNRLSDRELEVFDLISRWKGTREIAGDLNLSIKTVDYYREQIKKKLGLRSGADLVQAAIAWVNTGGKGLSRE